MLCFSISLSHSLTFSCTHYRSMIITFFHSLLSVHFFSFYLSFFLSFFLFLTFISLSSFLSLISYKLLRHSCLTTVYLSPFLFSLYLSLSLFLFLSNEIVILQFDIVHFRRVSRVVNCSSTQVGALDIFALLNVLRNEEKSKKCQIPFRSIFSLNQNSTDIS